MRSQKISIRCNPGWSAFVAWTLTKQDEHYSLVLVLWNIRSGEWSFMYIFAVLCVFLVKTKSSSPTLRWVIRYKYMFDKIENLCSRRRRAIPTWPPSSLSWANPPKRIFAPSSSALRIGELRLFSFYWFLPEQSRKMPLWKVGRSSFSCTRTHSPPTRARSYIATGQSARCAQKRKSRFFNPLRAAMQPAGRE